MKIQPSSNRLILCFMSVLLLRIVLASSITWYRALSITYEESQEWLRYESDGLPNGAKPEVQCDWMKHRRMNPESTHKTITWMIIEPRILLQRNYLYWNEISYELKDYTWRRGLIDNE